MTFPLSGAAIDLWFEAGQYYRLGAAAVTDFLSCTRASNGYAKNADGTLTSFTSNALRIGRGTGLLVEDARTNSVVDSQDMSTANWNKITSAVVADQAVAPDGTTTMDKVSDGTTASVEHVIYQTSTAFTANTDQTFSVFVKDVDRRYVWVALQSTGAAGKIFCIADLQTGTITDSGIPAGNGGTATALTSATIETFTNGIYRISLTGKVNSSATQAFCVVALCDVSVQGSLSNGIAAYTGTNKSIYVWGAQHEKDVSFPSSYIPTTGAAATRAADAVTCIGNLNSAVIAPTCSVVMNLDTVLQNSVNNNAVLFCRDSSGGNSYISMGDAGSDTTHNHFSLWNNSVQLVGTLGSGTWNASPANNKAGYAHDGSGRSAVGNNGTVVTDANTMGTSSTGLTGAPSPAGPFMFAYCKRLTVWNTRLADATLQALTDPNSANYYPNFVTQQARRVNVLQTGP